MADNVVRRDVVQIGFDVESDPLKELKKAISDLQKSVKGIENVEKSLKGIGDEAEDSKGSLAKMADKAKDIKSKLQPALDKVDKSLSAIGKSAINAGKKIASGLGRTAMKAVKALSVGVAGVATGIAALTTASVKSFAEYEQLAGGAKKIFNEADISGILGDASNAYIDLGMSANDYLAAINNVGATFAATMGDQKGYNTAKQGLQAISDYATGTGKSVTELSDKYMMITRSTASYQSIADQFSGILPATSKDFLKQAQAAGFLSGQYTELTQVPIAEYQAAVSKMLEKGTASLGLAGNTAAEAMNTVSGSVGMLKAAWSNFLAGAADPEQDFAELTKRLIDSAVAVVENIIPVVGRVLPNLIAGIKQIGEKIAPYIPGVLRTIADKIVEFAPQLGAKLKELILAAKDWLIENKDEIWEGLKTVVAEGIALVGELFTGEEWDVTEIKESIQGIVDKVMGFVDAIRNNWPLIKGIIIGVAGAIGALKLAMFACNAVIAINNTLTKIKAAGDLLMAAKTKLLNKSVWASVKAFGAQAMALMTNPITWIVIGIIALIAAIVLLIKNWDKVKEVAAKCWAKVQEIWGKVKTWFNENVLQPIIKVFTGIWEGIVEVFSTIGTWINENVIQPIVKFFKGLATVLFVIVAGIVGGICQTFIAIAGWVNENVIKPVVSFFRGLWRSIKSIVGNVVSAIQSIWGKISGWVNENVIQPVVNFFTALWTKIRQIVNRVWTTICNVWSAISGWVNDNVIQPVVGFFTELFRRVKQVISGVWETLCNVWSAISGWVDKNVISPIKKFFVGLWESITKTVDNIKTSIVDAFQWAYDKVTGAWEGIKDFFSGLFTEAVKLVAKPVNKLIDGANWVLEKFGSDKEFGHWEPYARGTDGHPGGNAIVNDGRGAELVQFPNGRTFIPQGRNVGIPNAPKGMRVLNAERTAQLMGRSSPTFRYEEGTGWSIWDFFTDLKGLAGKIIEKFVNFGDIGGFALDAAKSAINMAKDAVASWVKGLFDVFGGKSASSYDASKGVEQWRSTVTQALSMEGLNTASNISKTLYQMKTESGGNPKAINNWDSNAKKGTPSKGLMQVIDPTFRAYARSGYNKDIYDPLSNILASVRYAVARYGSLDKAYRGVGYAGGIGKIDLPVYTPASSVTNTRTSNSNTNNYNPSFALTMNGTVDRTTERTVKRWVKEALDEVFESMSRTSPRLTEV